MKTIPYSDREQLLYGPVLSPKEANALALKRHWDSRIVRRFACRRPPREIEDPKWAMSMIPGWRVSQNGDFEMDFTIPVAKVAAIQPILTIAGIRIVRWQLNKKVHRHNLDYIVAKAFIPNPFDHRFVAHLNRDPIDCRSLNLHWSPRPSVYPDITHEPGPVEVAPQTIARFKGQSVFKVARAFGLDPREVKDIWDKA